MYFLNVKAQIYSTGMDVHPGKRTGLSSRYPGENKYIRPVKPDPDNPANWM